MRYKTSLWNFFAPIFLKNVANNSKNDSLSAVNNSAKGVIDLT